MGIYFVGILLVFAGLVLASIILCLKSKALGGTHPSRLSKVMHPDSSLSVKSSCQTCHVCGGLRLRTQNQAFHDPLKLSKSDGNHIEKVTKGQCRPNQHTWGEIGSRMVLHMKQAFQKLINYHKKQVHVEFLMKLLRLKNDEKQKSDSCLNKGGRLPTSGADLASSAEGTDINSIDAAQTVEPGNVLAAQETQKATGTYPPEFHRVILEFLVSRCDNDKESSPTVNPGVRLTLQTGATQRCLAVSVDAPKNKETKSPMHNHDSAEILHGATLSVPDVSGSGPANDNRISQRLNQILKEAILLPKCEIMSSDSASSKVGKDFTQTCHVSEGNTDASFSKCATSAAEGSSSHFGHPKLKSSNYLHGIAMSDVSMGYTGENSNALSMTSGTPLNSVGSLSVSFLNLSKQEENADVKGQAASVLASLNVSENLPIGRNLSHERVTNKVYGHVNTSCHKSILKRAPEAISIKEDGHASLQGSTEESSIDDCCSHLKSTKKKKKMKSKKPKVLGDTTLADAKQMQEIGRVALEVAKHVSAVPEREYGCVCGALKGGRHNDSCSFPFTCSGSMLQRKLQEQYNQLVRSNAAKTLTLAQVGQFASCLVEAKVTLQQKSEMIQRKYTIAKSLLSKADKSSFDRLQSQIYGLEIERKKLEEDTIVYNRLQAQLKLSPAYQKMLEYGRAHFELHSNSGQIIEKLQPEDSEMSFEEFLEQEKKDEFWQRRNFSRSATPSR